MNPTEKALRNWNSYTDLMTFHVSPLRNEYQPSHKLQPIGTNEWPEIEIRPRVTNVPPWIRKPRDSHWKKMDITMHKFVDDSVNIEKVNMRREPLLTQGEDQLRIVKPEITDRVLNHVCDRENGKGMVVNHAKTTLMCVSAAKTYKAEAVLEFGNTTIKSTGSMRILGITLNADCSFKQHVANVCAKFRSRTWVLAKLKKCGMSEEHLLKTYKGMIRPHGEYLSPVWHPLITADQSAAIERQQSLARRNIYGNQESAARHRARSGLEMLGRRRENACLNFAIKALNNPRCNGWFIPRPAPLYARRASTLYRKFAEPTYKTDRYFNSPKNYCRRLLNSR